MTDLVPIKVFIRNLAGEYLSGSQENWFFTTDRAQAHPFDYHADDVAAQLEQAQRNLGVLWIACPADPQLGIETCDACGQKLVSLDAHFDGSHILCLACAALTSSK